MWMIILAATMLSADEGELRNAPITVAALPIGVGVFEQQFQRRYTTAQGLPSNDVSRIDIAADGVISAVTADGSAVLGNDRWQPRDQAASPLPPQNELDSQQLTDLQKLAGESLVVRGMARAGNETAVAADAGLYLWNAREWRMALPRQGTVRWAPVDVRAVAYDPSGALWFASPQGVGRRMPNGEWALFTAADGLPYNDFTCIATGPKGVWFGTTNGALQYSDGVWRLRQGGRWLLDNHVRDIAVDAQGNAWIATSRGVSCIASQPTTLAEKADAYRTQIERYHRRTSFGFVNPAKLAAPGDTSTAVPTFTDNDGHDQGLYLGAVALGYAATRDPKLKRDAADAFRALAFLGEVTEGGAHPAPKGFVARAVMPTSGPDPNPDFDLAYDTRRKERDARWKVIQPRWPVDASGKWYWKNDSSSDELDGHFFGYATYYDHACESESDKDGVRAVVRRIVDHVLSHGFNMVDYDGQPTRWGHFSPDDLNRNEAWCAERGLNSFSILTYLAIAHHVTGDLKYREVYLELALKHGYGMNGMTQPRDFMGPGTFGQPDDNMAFMNYYHLIRYETDPKLLSMFYFAIQRHWQIEKYERNPFENFIYAACCLGKTRTDHWGSVDLSPPKLALDDAIDTLKRYPLDLIDWPMSNAHRLDMTPLQDHLGHAPGVAGHRNDGYVFPIDERYEIRWDRDPWVLAYHGDGTTLRDPVHYLLAYYMGRAHGFIAG